MAACAGISRSRCCISLRSILLQKRGFCSAPEHVIKNGVVLGAYEEDEGESNFKLTRTAAEFNSKTSGRFKEILKIAGFKGKLGNSKTFYGIDRDYPCVVAVGLGKEISSVDSETGDPEEHEDAANVRLAAGAGAKSLRSAGVEFGEMEPFTDAQAAAEGSMLALYRFDKLKSPSKHKLPVELKLYGEGKTIDSSPFLDAWNKGKIMANSQNFARDLSSSPANLMTPTIFTHTVKDRLGQLDNVNIKVRGEEWARNMKMEAFLCVGKASSEESLFMEITYTGAPTAENPIVFVGKGVTFDSGGISIKPSSGMAQMKGDMTGAATVCAALEAIALLKLPVNVTVLTPLCENMVSGSAVKPGDVVKAMNGTTIEIDNTDAEGRLILADALCYADSLSPSVVVDVATLTGAIDVAIGQAAAGVFSNSRSLWHQIVQAGFQTGERMWRMPLYKYYKTQIKSEVADIRNVGKTRGGGACTAAAFLQEFTKCKHWAHIDIAGIMNNTDALPYLDKGNPGRPTRALVELVSKLSYNKIE